MKFSGRRLAWARPVIGKVEVFEANTASGLRTASAFTVTSALIARSSNTASITRSQCANAPWSVVGVMRSSSALRSSTVRRPCFTALSSRARLCARPFSAAAIVVSSKITSMPAFALT
jgi:hypothetical protein